MTTRKLGRWLWIACLGTGLATTARAASPVRSTPTRPPANAAAASKAATVAPSSELPAAQVLTLPITVGKIPDYVPIEFFAQRYGLEQTWLIPQRRLVLKNAAAQIEIDVGSRELKVNGMRVFLGDPARIVEGGVRISRVDGERLLAGFFSPAAGEHEVQVITVDAGHGGTDTGTQNEALKLQEKTCTLAVARLLKKALEELGYRVVLTRANDSEVGLGARAVIANEAGSDLFISIHFNSVRNDPRTRGAEVFTFAPQFQRSTNAWGKGQVDDMEALPAPVNRFDVLSVACAHAVHRALLQDLTAEDRGQKIAHWGVLRPLNCPGILVEAGFLSHPEEGKKIATPEYQEAIARAVAKGVKAYAERLAP